MTNLQRPFLDIGLTPPEDIQVDGVIHRFATNENRADKAGYYCFHEHPDGFCAGFCGDWRSGKYVTWHSGKHSEMLPPEHADIIQKMKIQAKAEREAKAAKAAEQARDLLGKAGPADGDYPYLKRKKIRAYPGVKQDRNKLLIPVRDVTGEIRGLQQIFADGAKRFTPGTKTAGCFFKIIGKGKTLYIVEGYATGASVYEATGGTVVVAFNAGNLVPVARLIRKCYPEREIVICADNDAWTDNNPGIEKASEAARAVNGLLAAPEFKDVSKKPTDFNDLYCLEGLDVVREQLEGAYEPDSFFDMEQPETKPSLDMNQFDGLAKDSVELACRDSEADPAGVLFTFLARFGVEVGRGPHIEIGDARHHPNLSVVLVGESSLARKGTSAALVNRFFDLSSHNSLNSQDGFKKCKVSPGPFSSGEGVIYAVRDAIEKWNPKKREYEVIDPGVEDKRLFVLDEEFSGILANTKREGNTLSMIIRRAWDNGTLDCLTKNNKIQATDAHIGWTSHITMHELLAKLPESEGFNGFANRILWVFVQRKKLVPMPEPMPKKELSLLQSSLLNILELYNRREHKITFTNNFKHLWISKYYPELNIPSEGLAGIILNRGPAQVRRLALLFTLLDGKTVSDVKHLDQAMAAWRYVTQSVNYIFKGQAEDPIARKILDALHQNNKLTGTEIHNLFSRHVDRQRIQIAIQDLTSLGLIEVSKQKTQGRPIQLIKIKTLCEKSARSETSPDLDILEGVI